MAWVRLDECNTRPGAFWPYVVAALRRSGVACPGSVRAPHEAGLRRTCFCSGSHGAGRAGPAGDAGPRRPPPDHRTESSQTGSIPGRRCVGSGLRLVASARTDPLLPLHRYRLAGQLAEIRAADLRSTSPRRACAGPARVRAVSGSFASLIQLTEGWAAGLRLAAISMAGHPDPDRVVEELVAEDSALTGYLVEEVLNAQPPEVREVLLSTSILDQVNAEAASELAGTDRPPRPWRRWRAPMRSSSRSGRVVPLPHPVRADAAAHAEAGMPGPDRLIAPASRPLVRADRHAHRRGAARRPSGDWQLAASMVIDGLAIGEVIEPRGGPSLADEFAACRASKPGRSLSHTWSRRARPVRWPA